MTERTITGAVIAAATAAATTALLLSDPEPTPEPVFGVDAFTYAACEASCKELGFPDGDIDLEMERCVCIDRLGTWLR